MKDLGFHLLLFVLSGIAIVTISAMFSEPEDGRALRVLPRRLLVFFVGCLILTAVMLILEHTLATAT